MCDVVFEQVDVFFMECNMNIELEMLEEVFKMYINDILKVQQGVLICNMGVEGVLVFMLCVKMYFVFVDKKCFEDFKVNYSVEKLQQDFLFVFIKLFDDVYQVVMVVLEVKEVVEKLQCGNCLFVDVVCKM